MTQDTSVKSALFQLGFRPFFLMGALFSILSVALWLLMTGFNSNPLGLTALSPTLWHAHEMVYGYAIAVVAGFLLTAVRNWTGVATVNGLLLMLLVLLWALARLMPFVPSPSASLMMAGFDLGFNLALCVAILHPIIKSGAYKHLSIWSALVLFMLSNVLFYSGLFGWLDNGVSLGLYSGLYVIIALMLIIARRVQPMFITNGVGYPVDLTNRRWVDIACVSLMPIFIVAEVFLQSETLATLCAALLFVLHAIRMVGWHTHGIWKKPMLWVLYIAYGWITLGFGLTAAAYLMAVNPMLAVHAFAYGGIGMLTIGMMARVSLGHTGRDINQPPGILVWAFSALFIGAFVRVALPMIAPQLYPLWISAAQVLWLIAFASFLWAYTPILIRARIDGRAG